MFNFIKSETLKKNVRILPLVGVMLGMAGLTSCKDSFIFEEDKDCHSGINLRFIYEYHMEPGANSFPANVDCVTVYVFDEEGNYVDKYFSETSEVLRDESYRMHLPLPEGNYHLVVYGGVTCDHNTFNFSPDWQHATRAFGDHLDDIRVSLPLNEKGESANKLHDIAERTGGLFYGTLDITITDKDWQTVDQMRTETVYMMKDTNNIQVILQELSFPNQIDYNDYTFKIVDDNFVLDGYNKPIHISTESYQPYYSPYAMQNKITGYVEPSNYEGEKAYEDPENLVQVACAEFSTSRLLLEHLETAKLLIYSNKELDKDGKPQVIIDMPLITYLAATRGFGQSWIRDTQEYLDRQSNWTLMFFLRKNLWIKTSIVVNEWTVRINDIYLDL